MTSTLLHLLPLSAFHADRDSPIRVASLQTDGFVHCSQDVRTALAVANTVFRPATEPMIALELDPAKLSAPVRWEPAHPSPPYSFSPDQLFPHVYGPLERSAVIGVRYARRDQAGDFVSLETRNRTAEEFDLLPHPSGGWHRRTWTSPQGGSRPVATAGYFLLPPAQRSEWRSVDSDVLWLWHRGGPLVLLLGGDGPEPAEPEQRVLGAGAGQSPQLVVPGGVWYRAQAAATVETLVSCVASPGMAPV
ncbi:cupin domain-containing protein [Saccharopolyspora indica]|uniref:cupin domain-containing protein n=1 Tax=Saccharopolyspora indica TaxID=1229659 RepID=UPI0022EAE458|nr:cupin domain-containing protein [Saccharopolyspora indica]MDA3646821.1 cupin domain-containing protein [Saccharopolyspora indica]